MNKKMVVLAGNPNVGKSTVFNALTGMRQHTGNWTGKTVATAKGGFRVKGQEFELFDLPGTYSLSTRSRDEKVASDFLREGGYDAVVVVCDSTCLERNLYLARQIMELGGNVIVCLNLMDEAKRKGMVIDLQRLEERLGVPVVGVSARSKKSVGVLAEVVHRETIERTVGGIRIAECQAEDALALWRMDPEERIDWAESVCKEVVAYSRSDCRRNDRRIDKYLTSKRTGFPIMLSLLALIFYITLRGANVPTNLLFDFFFQVGGWVRRGLCAASVPEVLVGALVDGVYRVLAWVVAVMLPPMAIFFPLFTLLEDFGYLPRVAFNLDKYFCKARACGKQALTMCMGFGCNAAGVTGCRIIESPRERFLAILTNGFVPCNGRFAPPRKG